MIQARDNGDNGDDNDLKGNKIIWLLECVMNRRIWKRQWLIHMFIFLFNKDLLNVKTQVLKY